MLYIIDGIEIVKRIQALESGKYGDLPIIALTVNAVSGFKSNDQFRQ